MNSGGVVRSKEASEMMALRRRRRVSNRDDCSVTTTSGVDGESQPPDQCHSGVDGDGYEVFLDAMELTDSSTPLPSQFPYWALGTGGPHVSHHVKGISASDDLNPHSSIDCSQQWEKGECIGGGSFGQVYLGSNRYAPGQYCAIKEVLVISNDPHSKEQLKQLKQEIYLLEKLSHPNIVRYYGSTLTDYAISIYMEYVSEGSIHTLLRKHGPFKESVICNFTAQILSGLAYLHERKHIHRDIKGANILVGPNGEVKLADFGLAKHISTMTAVHTPNSGTPYWMAPEVILSQYSGKGYNLSADIWSLGCTVIEMATGKHPFHPLEAVPALWKIGNGGIPEIPGSLSEEGKDFLQLCLQRDPKSRPSATWLLMNHPFVQNHGTVRSCKIRRTGQSPVLAQLNSCGVLGSTTEEHDWRPLRMPGWRAYLGVLRLPADSAPWAHFIFFFIRESCCDHTRLRGLGQLCTTGRGDKSNRVITLARGAKGDS